MSGSKVPTLPSFRVVHTLGAAPPSPAAPAQAETSRLTSRQQPLVIRWEDENWSEL